MRRIIFSDYAFAAVAVSWLGVGPLTAQDSTQTSPLPIAALLDSAQHFLMQGKQGHAEIFAREALARRGAATQAEYLRALLILARGLHPGEVEITVLRDTTRYPLLRSSANAPSGEAVVLDLISDGTRHLVQRTDTAEQLAWSAFDRVFSRERLASGIWYESQASPDLQIRVLELLAGALYPRTNPSDTSAAQRADGVRSYLTHIVRLDPNWSLSPLVNWRWFEGQQSATPSLNDLYEEAYDSTFGMSARRLYQPSDPTEDVSRFAISIDEIATNPDGARIWNSRQSVIAVQSNRPATFTLSAIDPQGSAVAIDSIPGPTERGVLSFDFLEGGDPRLPQPRLVSARYTLLVQAVASDSIRLRADTLQRCFASELIEAPPIPIPLIPDAGALEHPADLSGNAFANWQTGHPDSAVVQWRSQLRPEAERTSRLGTAVRGFGLGLSAALLANGLRNSEVRGVVPSDSRAIVIGGAVALSSIVAALTSRPIRNMANVRHNEAVRLAFRSTVRTQWGEFAQRIQRIRPTIRIGGARLCPS